ERVHPQLSVSAVSSHGWTLAEDLAFWAAAGIDHVGLSLRKLEQAGLPEATVRIEDAGLRVSDIVEVGWWDLREPATWPRQQGRLVAAVDVAARLGGCLVVTTGPAFPMGWDDAVGALDAAIDPVRTHADAAGVPVTVEPTGALRLDLSFCTTVRDGVDLARALDVGLCLECNSHFAERDLLHTLAGAIDLLTHVQVSDFHLGSLTSPDRAVPGDGDIPFPRLIGAIQDLGYTGTYEIEMVGPRIEAEGYASAIGRAVDYLDGVLYGSR
ncbi:MAG: sugar phosphate isomerase/epimerase, partial [Actinobacteria bacterium]|nr:sugar phosphate isomerase/epimerase [Actinomycetota bacterium]